jgi:uncharacterized lipoprotein YddW (UPF0748 family)
MSRDPEAFRMPVEEVRGMWVVRSSVTSPQKIRNVIATSKRFGFNTLFVQVRGRGDAYYTSTLEPRSEELSNQPLTFDPLAMTITLAHDAGIQVHAWVNTDFVWGGSRRPLSPDHILNKHPDWIARTSKGTYSTVATAQCEGVFVTPANPEVRQHNHDVFMELVKNYDLDGIHFDYIRYPNQSYDFSPATTTAFCADMTTRGIASPGAKAKEADKLAFIKAHYDDWSNWRRAQVTDMVESISRDAHDAKPGIVVSAAVFANWREAYVEKGQDWHRWLADGALDAVVPMAYSSDTSLVASQIADAARVATAAGRHCYAGLGAWHIPAAGAIVKTDVARAVGAQGVVLFSYGGVTRDGESSAYLTKYTTSAFVRPATLPKMAWNVKPGVAVGTAVPAEGSPPTGDGTAN